jgi:hypothetical protein
MSDERVRALVAEHVENPARRSPRQGPKRPGLSGEQRTRKLLVQRSLEIRPRGFSRGRSRRRGRLKNWLGGPWSSSRRSGLRSGRLPGRSLRRRSGSSTGRWPSWLPRRCRCCFSRLCWRPLLCRIRHWDQRGAQRNRAFLSVGRRAKALEHDQVKHSQDHGSRVAHVIIRRHDNDGPAPPDR